MSVINIVLNGTLHLRIKIWYTFLHIIHLLQLLDVLLMLGSKLLNVSCMFLGEFYTNMLNHIISVLLLGPLIPKHTPPRVNLIHHLITFPLKGN